MKIYSNVINLLFLRYSLSEGAEERGYVVHIDLWNLKWGKVAALVVHPVLLQVEVLAGPGHRWLVDFAREDADSCWYANHRESVVTWNPRVSAALPVVTG